MRQAQTAFTLIELLVVITIIVVLLALLAPALDKAIYQAELAVCGAQTRGITQSSIAYAMEYQRNYPHRGVSSSYSSMEIKSASAVNIPGLLQDYVAVKNFVDPFLAAANLNLDEAMRDPNSYLLAGYHMYVDWGGGANVGRMKKFGGKMTFTDPDDGKIYKFSVIISDRDGRRLADGANDWAQTSHSDKDGLQTLWSYQDGGNPWLSGAFIGDTAGGVEGNFYVAWWSAAPTRGPVDNNYGMDDGSVLRLDDVPVVGVPADDDPRIAFVQDVLSMDEWNTGRKTQLPRTD